MKTREEWLLRATERMRFNLFARNGAEIPEVKVSVGFPAGSRPTSKHKTTGQYWPGTASTDGIAQVFISPIIDKPIEALEILAHELVHAVYPTDGHGSEFGRLARAIGLEGPLTATVAGEALKAELEVMAEGLGEFPHSAINFDSRKKQSTRLVKVWCKECGYTLRATQKWISKGTPSCVCNGKPMDTDGIPF